MCISARVSPSHSVFTSLVCRKFFIGHFFSILFLLFAITIIVFIIILLVYAPLSHVHWRHQHRPISEKNLLLFLFFNVQPEITDLFLLGPNVTVPNWTSKQLVILVIKDYALSRVDNRTVLSLACVIRHDLDARKATHPAMFRVIICHLWLGLSRNCRESKLLRGRAKKKIERSDVVVDSDFLLLISLREISYHVIRSLTRMSVR